MIDYLSFILAACFLLGAAKLYFVKDASQSRTFSKLITGVLFFASVLLVTWESAMAGKSITLMQLVPITLCLVALAICSFAPIASHKAMTFFRLFLLFAISQCFFYDLGDLIQVLCCVLTTCVVWWELRSSTKPYQQRAFLIYQVLSCVFLLLGVGLFKFDSGNSLAVYFIVVAIMIRQGLLPFQSWFVGFVQHAPMGIVLAYCIPQLLLFFKWSALGSEVDYYAMKVLTTTGAFTAMLAALLALAQTDGRRVLGYLMLSQSGFLCFAFSSQSSIALQGAFLWWLNSAIAITGFALVLNAVESRRGALDVAGANGNFSHTPKLAISFLLFGFAFVGFPSTLGYVAEDLLIQGSIANQPFLAVMLVVATAFNGFNIMRMFMMLFTGRKQPRSEPDLLRRETMAATVLLLPIFILGLIPSLITQFPEHSENTVKIESKQINLASLDKGNEP